MPSLPKVLKAFYRDTQYLPIPYPAIPEVNFNIEKPSSEDIKKYREAFSVYEKECADTKAEIDSRFEMALERIKLCAFLNGFMNPFGQGNLSEIHFKWCPHKEWMNFTKPSKSYFPLESKFL